MIINDKHDRLCSQTQTVPTEHQDSNSNTIRPNQIMRNKNRITWHIGKNLPKKQSKLECHLALNTVYNLSEHGLAIEGGLHRQTWLLRENRL
jgi:hypothetical protein